MEYFELKKNYWIARWLKKPSTKDIIKSEKDIRNNNRIITIGLSDSITDRIVYYYKKELRKCKMFGLVNSDYNDIASKMELPKALIILVLERKGIITMSKGKRGE